MRSTITAMLSLITLASLVSGCSYSWSGPELRRLGEVPHWPDCDEDGWGDPLHVDGDTSEFHSCREVGAPPELFSGVTCPVVENNLDCDDSFDLSGADYTGSGCAANVGPYLGMSAMGEGDYAVVNDNQREFMVVNVPLHRLEAGLVCEAWSIGVQTDSEQLVGFSGVATLDTSGDRQSAERVASEFGEPILWVGVRFVEDGSIVWDDPTAETPVPVDLAYCDGGAPITPFEAFRITQGLPLEGNTEVEQQQALDALVRLEETMLLPVRFGIQQTCIERPLDTCGDYETQVETPDPTECPLFPVLCEREYIRPTDALYYQTSDYCDG